jgi:RNA polymerase sigma-70 factor (TIGR02943 family)
MSNNITDWVEQFSDDLYFFALGKTSDQELARDLVQETFLAAYHGINKFKNDSAPKTWLMAILKNKINDHYRKAFKQPFVSLEEQTGISLTEGFFDQDDSWRPDKSPAAWHTEEKHLLDTPGFPEVLNECMKKLPPDWSTAMKLKYLSGKQGKEICRELGISLENFWQITHRAKLQLRDCLETNWFKN